MTISRVNGGSWGVGDKLTSSQANALDINTTHAVDNRAGGDTVLGQLVLSGAGQVIESVATGANADTTYLVTGGNNIIRVTSAVTANRNYTLSATSAVTGSHLFVYCEPSFVTYEITVKDQASASMYVIGNLASSDGQWAEFVYVGGWRLLRSSGAGGARHHSQTFTSNGTFTVPANVFKVHVMGCGAGGGGAVGWTGGGGNTGTDVWGMGGGGGGAALLCSVLVDVTPGASVTVTLGTGAAATDGGDTTFGALATFSGGGAGQAGSNTGTVARAVVQGGAPVSGYAQAADVAAGASSLLSPTSIRSSNGQGGYGGNRSMPSAQLAGCRQAYGGFAGGAGGSGGTDSGSYRGGGGGGGGAAGPYGVGGAAGSGGNGNNGGAGTNATSGTAGAANTGAGGGGGGAGGYGSSAGSTSGSGGAGGSGQLTVFWVR